MALGGVADVGEDALDIAEVGPPAPVEPDASSPAFEQGVSEVFLEHADAVGDGGGGDPEFLGGAGKAFEAGGGFEEAEAVERREVRHGGVSWNVPHNSDFPSVTLSADQLPVHR